MKSAELVVKNLVDAGVKNIFGLTGHTTLGVLDAIYNEPRVRFIPIRHEQVASCAADGYARATGSHGVCLSHVGPGAANLVMGVAGALRDSSPVVALTCNEDTEGFGRGVFQEWEQTAVFEPITKLSVQIKRPKDVSRLMRVALLRAVQGRPGPVQIDLPMNVMAEDVPEGAVEKSIDYDNYSTKVRPDPDVLTRALRLILQAERPLIVAGGGVLWSGASEDLTKLAEKLMAPVAVTHTARGSIPETHPLFAGMLGRWGYKISSDVAKDSDLILAIGCRFADINTLRWSLISDKTKTVHVDIDQGELGRQYPSDYGILSDARMFCVDALDTLGKLMKPGREGASERTKQIHAALRAEMEDLNKSSLAENPIMPHRIIKEINEISGGNCMFTIGSGKHAEFANKVFVSEPRAYMKSIGFGSMGWAFPASIGAKAARPDKNIVCLVGDGDFIMSAQDLETSVREKLPVTVVVFNDSAYTSIKRFQERFYGGRFIAVNYKNPEYSKLAEIYGAAGERIENASQIKPAVERALKSEVSTVLNVMVDPKAFPPTVWGIMGLTK